MNSSDLNRFFNNELSGKALALKIKVEVLEYAVLLKKKGSCINLRFTEDQDLLLTAISFKKLLFEILSGSLSNIHLAYICDCITLGERIDIPNERLNDLIFGIADPEINGGYKSDAEINAFILYLEKF